jgi:hypothetical protein
MGEAHTHARAGRSPPDGCARVFVVVVALNVSFFFFFATVLEVKGGTATTVKERNWYGMVWCISSYHVCTLATYNRTVPYRGCFTCQISFRIITIRPGEVCRAVEGWRELIVELSVSSVGNVYTGRSGHE